MENLKYNVGDKVLLLDLSYLNRLFLNEERIIQEYTVAEVSGQGNIYFYIYYHEDTLEIDTTEVYQKTGMTNVSYWSEQKKYYHKEKDRELIISEINKEIEKYDNFCKKNDLERINHLQKLIIEYQNEIKEIQLGNGSFKHGFEIHKNKDFKEKFLSIIKKTFN